VKLSDNVAANVLRLCEVQGKDYDELLRSSRGLDVDESFSFSSDLPLGVIEKLASLLNVEPLVLLAPSNKNQVLRIGTNIREYRTALGLSRQVLSDRCGLSTTAIQTIEGGAGNPTVTSICSIAKGLNVSIYTILSR